MRVPLLRRTGWIIASVLAAAFAIHASEGRAGAEAQGGMAEELLLLKEETVSIAARHEQPISEAPSNVYVITDEDIRQSGATDLPTILRRVPGIDVMQVTGADFNVSARGNNQLAADKMLVMVDGRSIYVDSQALVFWKAIPVTLPEIKRIEVLKGPASAVYGFNAFDGVINIITKSPEEMKGTTLQFGGGEFGTISSSAIQAGTIDKFGYRLSVGRDQNNQWRDRGALAFRDHKFNINTEYALSGDSKVLLSGGLVDANRFDGPVVGTATPAGTFAQGHADLAYERPNFFIRAWWQQFDDTVNFVTNPRIGNLLTITGPNGSSVSPDLANTYNGEAQRTIEFGAVNRLTAGVNYRLITLSNSNFVPGFNHENRFGVYLQDEWKLARPLTVVAGARYDLDTFIHPTISPRAALLYTVAPDQTLRAAVSVAYRPPSIAETFGDVRAVTNIPFVGTLTNTVKGSTNLDPEHIVSYELGYQGWFLKHRLRTRADLFFNHITNLISNVRINPNGDNSFANVGRADIYGGEAGVEFLATRWLTGFSNFSYEEIGQPSTNGRLMRGAPRFKFNIGLRGEWEKGLSGEAALYHVGAAVYPVEEAFTDFAPLGVIAPDPRVGSYNLLNLRAGYRFWHEKAEVAVSVFNALNDKHKEHPLGDTIGSRVMGWLTIRF